MEHTNKQIEKAINENKLVFFVGSGFSKCFKFPDWNEMVIDILNQLSEEKPKLKNYVAMLESELMTPVEVLEKIKEFKKEIYDNIKNRLSIDEKKADFHNHRKLWEISQKIITTNYDTALEYAKPGIEKINYNYDYEIGRLSELKSYLFKLHGSIENIDKCIIFEEDYKKLYDESDKKCAIFQLEKIITENTVIFLGFSLHDPYVCNIFESMNKLYSEYMNRHYIISVDDEDFSKYRTNQIKIDDWNNIDEILDEWIEFKNKCNDNFSKAGDSILNEITNSTKNVDNIFYKVALLIADPIDKKLEYNVQEVISSFSKLNIILDFYYLSVDNLRELDLYDYIIIFTQVSKNKIYIEDDCLRGNLLSIKELEENICTDALKGIYIVTNDFIKVMDSEINIPIISIKYDKKIKDMVFKVFRRIDKKYVEYNCKLINIDLSQLTTFSKGEAKINYFRANTLEFIDLKNIQGFIGRYNDLEGIISKIMNVRIRGQILNIKGSGGIGKTTTVKKVAYELAKRSHFKEGIYFIDCEHIDNYSLFEHRVSQCFEIDNTIDLVDHIRQNNLVRDSMIIMDNFETLLYIQDSEQIKELVMFISDYTTVIITSREVVYSNFDIEDVYELRNFTTDEAVELFIHNYPYIKENDFKILRVDIVENLLNNNPLAIKIVTHNLPKGKDIVYLKKELERDFFKTTNECLYDIYDKNSDYNIEKSKSLYQSINYSYRRLSEREKLAFELLAIFPDGIDIENFKEFFAESLKMRRINPITDAELKMLENKSLVEMSSQIVKLQSIIRRFAIAQFNSREEDDKLIFYKEAYNYNLFMVYVANEIFRKRISYSCKFFDSFSGNILESMNYINKIDITHDEKLYYIVDVSDYFVYTSRAQQYLSKLAELDDYFSKSEKLKLSFKVNRLWIEYMTVDFEKAYEELLNILSIEKINSLDWNDKLERQTISKALYIFFYEGHALEYLEYYEKNASDRIADINIAYFELGRYSKTTKSGIQQEFITFDMEAAMGKLNIDELTKYITQIYKKDYIEVMQCNYLKAKVYGITKEEITKLVVINPYTKGLKKLMLAFIETNIDKAIKLYCEAISNLQHIKYYYTEAIYYYSTYLKSINHKDFDTWYDFGYNQSIKYKYNFLTYKFLCLKFGKSEEYSENKFLVSQGGIIDISYEEIASTSSSSEKQQV